MGTRTCRAGNGKTHHKQSLKRIGQRNCATLSDTVIAEIEYSDGGISLVILGSLAGHEPNMCLVNGSHHMRRIAKRRVHMKRVVHIKSCGTVSCRGTV